MDVRVSVTQISSADPAPVAQTFYVDDKVKRKAHLDAVITVVDARHMLRHIEESRACLDQIAFADVILINKCDLATPDELDRVEARIRVVNAVARIQRITFGQAPVDDILEQGGFDLDRALESKPAFLMPEYPFSHVSVYELGQGVHELRLQAEHEDPLGVLIVPNEGALPELERESTSLVLDTQVAGVASGGRVDVGTPAELEMKEPGRAKHFSVHVDRDGEYALFAQYDPMDFGLTFTDEAGRPHTPLA